MFFSRQDRRNLSVDNHAMSVTTETATRIVCGPKKVPSLYRRRRALVSISSLFGRMVTERIAQVCSTRYKGQGRSSSHHLRLRHLPSRHCFQVGRRRSSEQLPCERSSSLENDKGLESPPALEAQLLFFELVRYPRLAQSLANCAMDKRNTAWIKTTLWPCYDQPTPSELVPEAALPKDT
jgi:hypothetical protein